MNHDEFPSLSNVWMNSWIYWMHFLFFLHLFACVRTYLECKYIKNVYRVRHCWPIQQWDRTQWNTRSPVRNLTWVLGHTGINPSWLGHFGDVLKWNRKHIKLLPKPHLIPSSSGTFTCFTSSRNFNELVCEECNGGLPRFVNIPGCHSCKTPGGVQNGSHICSDRS